MLEALAGVQADAILEKLGRLERTSEIMVQLLKELLSATNAGATGPADADGDALRGEPRDAARDQEDDRPSDSASAN